jgi:hypothetical protein
VRKDVFLAEGGPAADAEGTANFLAERGGFALGVGEIVEDSFCALEESSSGLGEGQRAGGTDEEDTPNSCSSAVTWRAMEEAVMPRLRAKAEKLLRRTVSTKASRLLVE